MYVLLHIYVYYLVLYTTLLILGVIEMIKLFITLLSIWLAAYVFTLAAEQIIKHIIERRRRAQALAQRERHNKRVARAIRRNRAEYYASEIDNEYFKILMRKM